MSNIRTLKALYQPISTAATRSVLSSVAQDEKDLAKDQAELSSIMKSAASLGARFAKDKKAFDLAREGGFGFNFKDALKTTDYSDDELENLKKLQEKFPGKYDNIDINKTAIQKALDTRGDKSEKEILDQFRNSGLFGGLRDFIAFQNMPDIQRDEYIKAGMDGRLSKLGTQRYQEEGPFAPSEKIDRPSMPKMVVSKDEDIPDAEIEGMSIDDLNKMMKKDSDELKSFFRQMEYDEEMDRIKSLKDGPFALKEKEEFIPDEDISEGMSIDELKKMIEKDRSESAALFEQIDYDEKIDKSIDDELDKLNLSKENPIVQNILSNAKTDEDKVLGLKNLNALKVEHNLDLQGDMLLVEQKGLGGRLLKTPGKAFTNPKLKFRNLESMEDVQTLVDKIKEQDKQAAKLEMKNVVEQQNKEEANKRFVNRLSTKRLNELVKNKDKFELAKIDKVFADPKYRDLNLKLGLDRSVLNKAISEENMDANLGLRNIFKKVGR